MIRRIGILEDVDANIEDWRFALDTHDPQITLLVFRSVAECLAGAAECDVLILDNEIEHPGSFEVEYSEENLKAIRESFSGVLVWYSSVLPSPENRHLCDKFLQGKYPLPDMEKFIKQTEEILQARSKADPETPKSETLSPSHITSGLRSWLRPGTREKRDRKK